MNRKVKRRGGILIISIVLFCCLGICLFLSCRSTKTQQIVEKKNKPEIVKKIEEAHEILKPLKAGFALTSDGKKVKSYNVLLTAMNLQTGVIEVILVRPDGSDRPDFDVECVRLNGLNSDWRVIRPEGYVVLRNKRVVKSGFGWEEVDYTGYTPGLEYPELIDYGYNYVWEIGLKALKELKNLGVDYKPLGGEISDENLLKYLVISVYNEHSDPGRATKESKEQLFKEISIVIAANKENAYKHSNSSAGARGFNQFIKSTYDRIVKRFPEAQLDVNFVSGTDNHLNGSKAAILLKKCDFESADPKIKKALITNPHFAGQYVSAAYNGGSGRVNKAIKMHGDKWSLGVKQEARKYVLKFNAFWSLFNNQSV